MTSTEHSTWHNSCGCIVILHQRYEWFTYSTRTGYMHTCYLQSKCSISNEVCGKL